jgi:hypothetical protein
LAGLPITSHDHHRDGSEDDPGARAEYEVDEAQLAAISFLARYSGRTLEAYRHDLRGFFQWATDHGIAVMKARRARSTSRRESAIALPARYGTLGLPVARPYPAPVRRPGHR